MFDAFKKLIKPFQPQASFMETGTVSAAQPLPGLPGPAEEPKTRWTRFKEFLPSAACGAGAVYASKFCAGALCAGVSAPALATAATAVTAGAVASQLMTYVHERKAELKAANGGHEVSLFRDFEAAAARREISTFFSKDRLLSFGKGALIKGIIGGGLGAGLGFAASNETVQTYAHKALDAAKNFNPLEKLQHALFGNPSPAHSVKALIAEADEAKKIMPVATDVKPAPVPSVLLSHPLETLPVAPPTALEKVRILMDVKNLHNAALDKMLDRAENGDAQAMKDLAYGLRWGKLGLVEMKELADALLDDAAKEGNAQAIRDQLVLAGKLPPIEVAAPAEPPIATPMATDTVPAGITDDSRERAATFIKAAYGVEAAAPAELQPPVSQEPPAQPKSGRLAGFCNVIAEKFNGATSVQASCERTPGMHGLMQDNDYYVMRSNVGIEKPYVFRGDSVPTTEFRTDALLDFIRNKVTPALQ